MILVCGGLADSVTELVCARLVDCGYPYRLLDLGNYPAGFRIKWHWQRSGLSGAAIVSSRSDAQSLRDFPPR